MRLACGCVSVFGWKKVLCTSCCSLRCAMLETWDSKDAVTGPLFAFQRTHFRVIAFRVSLWGIRDWLIQIWLHTFSPFFLQSLDMYLIDFPKSIFAFGEGYIQAGGIEFSLSLSLSFSLSFSLSRPLSAFLTSAAGEWLCWTLLTVSTATEVAVCVNVCLCVWSCWYSIQRKLTKCETIQNCITSPLLHCF